MENTNQWDASKDSAHSDWHDAENNEGQWQQAGTYDDDAPNYSMNSDSDDMEDQTRYAGMVNDGDDDDSEDSEDDFDDVDSDDDSNDDEGRDWGDVDPLSGSGSGPMDPSGPGSAV